MDEKKYEVGKKKTLSFADGKKLTSLILNTILNVKHMILGFLLCHLLVNMYISHNNVFFIA